MALTLTQRQLAEQLLEQYIADQSRAGNSLALGDFATSSGPAQKSTLLPYATKQLAGASASLAGLPAAQSAQTAAMTQAVTDAQALVTLLGG